MFRGSSAWLVVALVAVAAVAAPWFNVPRDQADGAGMLAHLHAFFVDRDLLYDDEYAALGMSPLFAFVTQTGVVSNHWSAGAAWLQAPGYLLGLLAGKSLAAAGVGKGHAMGVVPWLAARAWAIVVLVGIGWAIASMSRRRGASVRETIVLVGCFVVGTPLLYYGTEAALRPHLWGCAVTLGAVALWQAHDVGRPLVRTVALSGLVGLATYVRPQLAVLALLVVHDAWTGPDRIRRCAVGGVIVLGWMLALLRVQLWMYGTSIGDYAGDVSHHLGHFLLSPYHGALVWCPVLLIGFAAVGRAALVRERGAWIVLLIIAIQLWLDAGTREIEPGRVLGTRTWAGGVSFGPRKLVDVLPLMLPAIWSWLDTLRARDRHRIVGQAALALTVPTVLLHLAAFVAPEATTGTVHTWASLRETLGLVFDAAAWSDAVRTRALPLAVPVTVATIVAVPLAATVLATVASIRRIDAATRIRVAAIAAVAMLVVVHAWLAILILRSDAALVDDPQRMLRARAIMQPRHHATVERIEGHHAVLRNRLGPGAVPR